MLFDLGSGAFDDASVLNSGRASGLTGTAVETAVDVSNKGIADRQASAIDLQHLVDAATGRIHLHSQRAVCRTVVQAESTVNTSGVKIPRGTIRPAEVRLAHVQRVILSLLLWSFDVCA